MLKWNHVISYQAESTPFTSSSTNKSPIVSIQYFILTELMMTWPVTLPFWLSVISPCFSEDVNCKFWSPAVVTVWDFPLFFPSSLYSLPIISFSCMKKFYWLWLYAKYLSINSLQRLSPVSCQCLQLCLPWDTLAWAVSVPQLCPQPFKTFRTDKLQHKVQSKECSDTKNVKDQAENLLSNFFSSVLKEKSQ